ncbi:MAG: LpxI family protein [Firmicutes bacterium]|nr:LpxI family protein [Bacillota bacterium]
MAKVAVLAGEGNLPKFFTNRALKMGHEVLVIDLTGQPRADLAEVASSIHPVSIGQWQTVIDILKTEEVFDVYFLGNVSRGLLFTNLELDRRLQGLLANLRQRENHAMIEAFVEDLAKEGITVKPQTDFLQDALMGPGVLTETVPTKGIWQDIEHGVKIAKTLAELDVGQTVVVKDCAVLAVEAIDGTDATINRGGTLAKGGGVAVKIAKPNQDPRFDVPTVGPETIKTVIAGGLDALALEAGKTIVVNVAEVIRQADENKVSIVLVDPGK